MPRKQVGKSDSKSGAGGKKSMSKSKATESHKDPKPKSASSPKSFGIENWTILAIILALLAGWIHGVHISAMFERDRHFSHLSSLERDLTFRTEMGLYYSYFKTIVEELILGVGYRMFDSFTKANNFKTMECWTINRGDLPPVPSCEGIGDQHYFYITNIFFLNGLMLTCYFLYSWYLAGKSLWGGLITVAFVFFNHGECTRVMWTPPLRESYAMPFLVLELFLVTHMLKTRRPSRQHGIWIGLAAFSFMLPWQFAQFALLTQTAAVYGLYLLEFIGSYKMKILLHAQIGALAANFVFQFGNEMLLTSFYAASLLVILAVVAMENRIDRILKNFFVRVFVKVLVWGFGTLFLKKAIASILFIADDAHIWDILRSKFSTFQNFHTMLYTCAKEFDFIEISTIFGLIKTLLIPTNVIVCVLVAVKCLQYEYDVYMASKVTTETKGAEGDTSGEEGRSEVKLPPRKLKKKVIVDADDDPAFRSKPHAEIVYNVLQMFAFTFMAVMIMRLKLFMTPMMCIVSAIIANRQILNVSRSKFISILVVLLAMSCVQGSQNLVKQWNIMGEFENWPHEQLIEHINQHLPQEAVFAGAMPTMASIKLSCNRAIVNHPHYEDAGLRERTKKVYSMYSRKPLTVVHKTIRDMGVTHFVLENSWCVRKTRDGCQMPEIWDLEDVDLRGKTPACEHARNDPEPYFTEVFKNNIYTLLKVNAPPIIES